MKSIVLFLLLGLCTSQVLTFYIPDLFEYDYNWLDNDDKNDGDKSPVAASAKPLDPEKLIFDSATGVSVLNGVTNAIVQAKQNLVNVVQRLTQGVANIFALGTGTTTTGLTAALTASTPATTTTILTSISSSVASSTSSTSTLTTSSTSSTSTSTTPTTTTKKPL